MLARKKSHGAGERNRTDNLLFTKQLLCQLSYAGVYRKVSASPCTRRGCQVTVTAAATVLIDKACLLM
jgi:hypothetical protein